MFYKKCFDQYKGIKYMISAKFILYECLIILIKKNNLLQNTPLKPHFY